MNVSQADLWRICPHPTMTREGDVLRCDWCGIPYPTSKKRKNIMSHTTITLDAETAVDTLEDIQRRLEKRRLED